jgi:hypothetical protein
MLSFSVFLCSYQLLEVCDVLADDVEAGSPEGFIA